MDLVLGIIYDLEVSPTETLQLLCHIVNFGLG
jgi:hypothetical protein